MQLEGSELGERMLNVRSFLRCALKVNREPVVDIAHLCVCRFRIISADSAVLYCVLSHPGLFQLHDRSLCVHCCSSCTVLMCV